METVAAVVACAVAFALSFDRRLWLGALDCGTSACWRGGVVVGVAVAFVVR